MFLLTAKALELRSSLNNDEMYVIQVFIAFLLAAQENLAFLFNTGFNKKIVSGRLRIFISKL